ncbi:hypothetical protein GCM10022383_27280 [Microbacterium soli]|uniref:HNH nuclease domain-containing protein n=2 Tax=Microbacterium soli TaxID=446075 RepID=A0ABP7NIQ6_9MICO
MCRSHRAQSDRGAELSPIRRFVFGTARERFEARIVRGPGCWEWSGTISSTGYGQVKIDGRHVAVHRLSYELHVGPIPDGLVIDHLCSNRKCANPAHLEAVTQAENVRRARA